MAAKKQAAKLVAPTQPFATEDEYGRPVVVQQDGKRYAGDHWLVKEFPDFFTDADAEVERDDG